MVDQTLPEASAPALAEGDLHSAIEQLYFGYRAFTDQADRILEGHGLGRVHHRILYFVGRRPGISVKGLLAVLRVSKQAINAPLRRLLEMGLVDVAVSAADGRVKALSLSARGQALEEALSGAQMRFLAAAFAQVGDGPAHGWAAVMDALAQLGEGTSA